MTECVFPQASCVPWRRQCPRGWPRLLPRAEALSEAVNAAQARLFATLWTIQSMEFSRPGYWSGEPCPSPGDLPNPGIEPRSPASQADSLPAEPPGKQKRWTLANACAHLAPLPSSLRACEGPLLVKMTHVATWAQGTSW